MTEILETYFVSTSKNNSAQNSYCGYDLTLMFKGQVGCSEAELVNEIISSAFIGDPDIIRNAVTALQLFEMT